MGESCMQVKKIENIEVCTFYLWYPSAATPYMLLTGIYIQNNA
jgi:hypothetical protein